ncbi:MAG: hypothetical protein ABIF11_03105 [Nitrospirota bacterium]
MTLSAKREYVKQMQFIYRNASGKKEKTRLIRQISETFGCHKKHAGPAYARRETFKGRDKAPSETGLYGMSYPCA